MKSLVTQTLKDYVNLLYTCLSAVCGVDYNYIIKVCQLLKVKFKEMKVLWLSVDRCDLLPSEDPIARLPALIKKKNYIQCN